MTLKHANKIVLQLALQVIVQLSLSTVAFVLRTHDPEDFSIAIFRMLAIVILFLVGVVAGFINWKEPTQRTQWFAGAFLAFLVGSGLCFASMM